MSWRFKRGDDVVAAAALEHARLLADDLERRPHAQPRQHLRQPLRRVVVLRQDVVLGVEPERHVDGAVRVLAERMARAGKQQSLSEAEFWSRSLQRQR